MKENGGIKMNENLEEDKRTQEIIIKAEKSFLESDKEEPFLNREYAEETKRIFALIKNKSSMGDFEDPKDRAMFDVVYDILREGGINQE